MCLNTVIYTLYLYIFHVSYGSLNNLLFYSDQGSLEFKSFHDSKTVDL